MTSCSGVSAQSRSRKRPWSLVPSTTTSFLPAKSHQAQSNSSWDTAPKSAAILSAHGWLPTSLPVQSSRIWWWTCPFVSLSNLAPMLSRLRKNRVISVYSFSGIFWATDTTTSFTTLMSTARDSTRHFETWNLSWDPLSRLTGGTFRCAAPTPVGHLRVLRPVVARHKDGSPSKGESPGVSEGHHYEKLVEFLGKDASPNFLRICRSRILQTSLKKKLFPERTRPEIAHRWMQGD